MENFYAQLDKVCKQHNTTIYAIEKATKSSKGSFIKWRTSSPSAEKLIEIADLLGVSMDDLIGREIPQTKKAVPVERLESDTALLSNEDLRSILEKNDDVDFIEKLYKELKSKEQRLFVLTWLIAYMASEGLPVKQILGK